MRLRKTAIFMRFYIGNTLFERVWFKNQNCQFDQKFGIWTNGNMQNLIVMFTFPDFHQKYSFWLNLVQNIKINLI